MRRPGSVRRRRREDVRDAASDRAAARIGAVVAEPEPAARQARELEDDLLLAGFDERRVVVAGQLDRLLVWVGAAARGSVAVEEDGGDGAAGQGLRPCAAAS